MSALAIFLIFLLLAAIVIFRALIPIAVGAILMFIAIVAVCVIFKDIPGKSGNSSKISRAAHRAIGIGDIFFIPGIIICIQSWHSYRALPSGSLVFGGPRPIGVLLVMIGIGILIYGIVSFVRNRRDS